MLERLKEAYYRRTRDDENAALILRVERAMARLPATETFSQWVWSLPSELWEVAVAWRAATDDLIRRREHAVRLITRKNRLQQKSPDSSEAHAAEEELNHFKVELIKLEEAIRESRKLLGEPPA